MTPITLPRATVEQALEAMRYAVPTGKITLYEWDKAMAALRAALAQQPNPPGCDHCNHPLYAATKCRVCGRVTEQAEPVEPVEEPALPKRGKYRTLDEDILKMAREAWGEDHEIFWFDDNGIERFAALVRADERERIAAEWDGCMYGDLEDVDIGAAIRARSKE